MADWNRRRFIGTAALAAGSGLALWRGFGSHGLLAQAPLAGVPDEILNPVEVSGADAVPVMGKLPGQKRMYVLPAGDFRLTPAAAAAAAPVRLTNTQLPLTPGCLCPR